MSDKEAPGKATQAKGTPKSAKSTTATDRPSEGFTDEDASR